MSEDGRNTAVGFDRNIRKYRSHNDTEEDHSQNSGTSITLSWDI